MKKYKSFIALILALCFLSPTLLLLSCKDSNTETSSTPSTESEWISSEEESETNNSTEDNEHQDSTSASSPSDSSTTLPSTSDSSKPPVSTPQAPISTKAQYIKCSADSVNIRAGAGTEYTVLGSAENGTMYAVIGKTGNWYKTYYRNKIAYIYASYASVFTLEKTEDEVENVIAEGYKLLGVPYVYGAIRVHDGKGKLLTGFSAQKFDCSSLIQYIFYKGAGTLLNVHTRSQIYQGQYVKRQDLQRGDCIFFTNESRQYNTGVERIGHVALYLGDGYILHTASDYARIEKMSAKRWSFYVEARRFL